MDEWGVDGYWEGGWVGGRIRRTGCPAFAGHQGIPKGVHGHLLVEVQDPGVEEGEEGQELLDMVLVCWG